MNNLRRFMPALLIIVLAASVAWWSSHTASSVSNHVQEEVEKLVPRFKQDPSTIHSFVIDPVLEPLLASSLQLIYTEAVAFDNRFSVVVQVGDSEKFGDGSATHVATIQVNKKLIAGLRIICTSSTSPVQIAGVWTP